LSVAGLPSNLEITHASLHCAGVCDSTKQASMTSDKTLPIAWLRSNWIRVVAHCGALLPGIILLIGYFSKSLGVNPVQKIIQETGETGIRLLMLSMVCTPLVTLFRFRAAGLVRRALGLYGFYYIAAHLFAFSVLDFRLDLELIAQEVFEKPYIVAGLSAFVLLIPLALTSTRGWMKRLGKTWKTLHRVFYGALALGILHFWWSQKAELNQALLIYAPLLGLMLAARIPAIRRWFARR
jgi:methionine sulfoxide reductase heme-binding subunit